MARLLLLLSLLTLLTACPQAPVAEQPARADAASRTASPADQRIAANEAAVVEALRAIHRAQERFATEDPEGDFAFDYAETLGLLFEHGLIDESLARGESHGYRLVLESFSPYSWVVAATPLEVGQTGRRQLRINSDGRLSERRHQREDWRPLD